MTASAPAKYPGFGRLRLQNPACSNKMVFFQPPPPAPEEKKEEKKDEKKEDKKEKEEKKEEKEEKKVTKEEEKKEEEKEKADEKKEVRIICYLLTENVPYLIPVHFVVLRCRVLKRGS